MLKEIVESLNINENSRDDFKAIITEIEKITKAKLGPIMKQHCSKPKGFRGWPKALVAAVNKMAKDKFIEIITADEEFRQWEIVYNGTKYQLMVPISYQNELHLLD